MRRRFQLLGVVAAFGLVAGSSGASGTVKGLPLVGINYSTFGDVGCDFGGYGILRDGAGHRTLIRHQLAAMRAAGIQILRTLISGACTTRVRRRMPSALRAAVSARPKRRT